MKADCTVLISQFEQFKDGNNYVITKDDFERVLELNKNFKPKKKMCSYFVWLNENRKFIEKEYFSDFYDVEDWSIESKKKYYISKELDIDKVIKEGRPRIASLITTKAGILWKQLDESEKKKYEEISKQHNKNYVSIEEKPKEKRKRGRPRKTKEQKNVSDAVIENCNNKSNQSDNSEIKVEEIDFEGKTYYLDVNTFDIYDPETEEIVGKKNGTNIYIN